MKVRSIATMAGVAVGALAFMALGASPARASGIDGTGAVGTCTTTSGQIKIKPALTNTDSGPGALKLKAKILEGACSGGSGDGAAIVKGKSKGVGTTTMTTCAGLLGVQPASIDITVKWKTDGTVKLNPSVIHISSQTGGATMDGHGSFDATGTVTSGSFTGGSVTAHVETDMTLTDITTACGGKGLKKITFGLNNASTITIN